MVVEPCAGPAEDNPIAMEKAVRIGAFAELTKGHHPPPPQSIIEARNRQLASGSGNGSHPGSHNGYQGSWARVASNACQDDE
jgi:hypothetical protein